MHGETEAVSGLSVSPDYCHIFSLCVAVWSVTCGHEVFNPPALCLLVLNILVTHL